MKLQFPVHARQKMALQSKATEILYGGAAGGGKSHLFRVVAIGWCMAVPGLQVYLFRRESPDLWANHMEGPGSFPELLGPLIASKKVKINQSKGFIEFPNRSKIHLCHCQYEKDKYGYQGAEIHVLLMDELTHFTPSIYRYLRARCRVGGLVVPQNLKGMFPRILCGSNPGGTGHNWVKASFVDLAPPMTITEMPPREGGMFRQYIPAKLTDNPTVDAVDYSMKLQGLGNDALVKAMLDGDWNIVAGGMFDDVYRREVHEITPFDIPATWRIDRSFDWGSSHPFSVGWWAESDGTEATLKDGTKKAWPRGTIFRIAEWYGWNGTADEGCKLLAVEIARGIVKMESELSWGKRVQPGPADSSIYDAENGVCIADDMARIGVRWVKADKSPGSRKTGWEAMRKRFKACLTHPMESPGLFAFDTCRNGFIRTVPVLPRDTNKPEDVDTKSEDHAGDEIRYRCLHVQQFATTVRVKGI